VAGKHLFSDAWVAGLAVARGERLDVADERCEGLRLRASATSKTFSIVIRDAAGAVARRTLGSFPEVSVAEARRLADRARIELRTPPPEAERPRRIAVTFGELVDAYMTNYAKVRKSSWYNDERYLARPKEMWGDAPAASVTLDDVIDYLEALARTAPVSANRTKSVLRKLFNWSVARKYLAASPIADYRERPGGAERPKERVLSDDEIKALWSACGRSHPAVGPQIRQALRLILATGCRPGEIAAARVEHFDLSPADDPKREVPATWRQPAAATKAGKRDGRDHVATLNDPAIDTLREAIGNRADGPLFPGRNRNSALNRMSISEGCRRLVADTEGLEPFSPHDLRRTAATIAVRAGAAESDVGLLLGHRPKTITGSVYVVGDRLREKARASGWLQVALEAATGENFGAMR
jgi:integrase